MNESPEAWLIDNLQQKQRLLEQESQHEQLRLPLYEETVPEQRKLDEPKSTVIIIEL